MTTDETFNRRLTIVGVALVGISLVLLVRMLSFQFYMDPDTKQSLEENQENRIYQTVRVRPNRGQIYDRNGHLLAVNSYEYRIGISPNMVLDRQEAAADLAPLVGLPENQIFHALEPDEEGTFREWVLLAARVDFETGQKIMDLDIDGIDIEALPIRIYPQGELTAQLVGFYAGSEDDDDGRGYSGVEGFYDALLAGQSKRVTLSVIPVLEENETDTRVRNGIDLVLTIDRDLQFLAQEVLDQAIVEQGATGGTILIMNPRNGEILAIANYPTFKSDDFSPENMELISNQAVSSTYEPGSVFKVLTMAIAIESGIDYQTWTYHDPGTWEVAGIAISNWDRRARSTPNFNQVFIESLNTGTATLFYQIGPRTVYPMLREFGIGTPAGVDLEGESAGLLVEMGDSNWSEAQFLTTSFGQGVSVTPLQMLTAVNAIANGGLIMQPHIVKARIDGDEVIETQPSASYRPISSQTANIARDIMVQIVESPESLDDYHFENYKVAGKTGTAQIPTAGGYYDPEDSIASFVGFLPADDPVVSVLVKLDRPDGYWGSKTAAPVFQKLVEKLVVLMEIPPDMVRYQLEAQGGNPFEREY